MTIFIWIYWKLMWLHLTNDITITSENDNGSCSFTASQTEQNTYNCKTATHCQHFNTARQLNMCSIVESICDPKWPTPPKKKKCVKRFYCFKWYSRSWWIPERSLHKSDLWNGVNWHIFKMAAIETINCLWLILYPIDVLATNRKMGFLNRVNIFSFTYDERWRRSDVYDVI